MSTGRKPWFFLPVFSFNSNMGSGFAMQNLKIYWTRLILLVI